MQCSHLAPPPPSAAAAAFLSQHAACVGRREERERAGARERERREREIERERTGYDPFTIHVPIQSANFGADPPGVAATAFLS